MSKNRASRRREAAKQRRQQSASPPPAPRLSQSRGLRAVRAADTLHGLRGALAEIADVKEEWAGIPMPLEGTRLVIEPTYPYASLSEIGAPKEEDLDEEDRGWRLRNCFYSWRWKCDIIIAEKDGKITWGKVPAIHHGAQLLSTLGASDAWGIEQEHRALNLLGSMLRHRQFKQYLLTGMFLEQSARSGVMYVFRKLRPTIALAAHPGCPEPKHDMTILAALCQHPIAYYADSWAGAMCPTDDVIAHLALMRGDEHMFWKRSNQHPPHRPEAGI